MLNLSLSSSFDHRLLNIRHHRTQKWMKKEINVRLTPKPSLFSMLLLAHPLTCRPLRYNIPPLWEVGRRCHCLQTARLQLWEVPQGSPRLPTLLCMISHDNPLTRLLLFLRLRVTWWKINPVTLRGETATQME